MTMALHRIIASTLGWCLSIGFKLFRVVPIYTLAIVLATLTSQIALLLAFFLPLKVIILLGSPRVPSYFPDAWLWLERDHLIISLTAGAAGFYLLYLLAEKTLAAFVKRGAKRLVQKSRKIILFNKQDEFAMQAYHRYSRSLAGLVFVGLALVFIGILYPYLAIAVLGYGVIIFMLVSLVFSLRKGLQAGFPQNVNGLMNVLGGCGFLLAFTFMVADFLMGQPPGVIVAIVCLLLVRQLMIRVSGLVVDVTMLFTQRLQINSLFFHGQKFVAIKPQGERDFENLLNLPRRDEWVVDVLRNVSGVTPHRINCVWLQTGIANMVAFEVVSFGSGGQIQGGYLVKLFNTSQQTLALHEASLLTECAPGALPSPKFIGTDQVGSYHCHLFEWPEVRELSPDELGVKRQEVAFWLLTYEPPKALLERYRRSKLLLGQRLSKDMVKRLRLVTSNPKQLEQLTIFEKNIHQVKSRLQSLPVQIINPDIHAGVLKCTEGLDVKLIHWGRWSIEPIGAGWPVPGWPVSDKDLNNLVETLDRAKKSRKSLIPVVAVDIKLAALLFSFEHFFNRQQYVNALEVLPNVLAYVDNSYIDPIIERG